MDVNVHCKFQNNMTSDGQSRSKTRKLIKNEKINSNSNNNNNKLHTITKDNLITGNHSEAASVQSAHQRSSEPKVTCYFSKQYLQSETSQASH